MDGSVVLWHRIRCLDCLGRATVHQPGFWHHRRRRFQRRRSRRSHIQERELQQLGDCRFRRVRFNVILGSVTTTWTAGRKGDFDGDGAEELLGWNSSWNNNAGRWETIKYNDHPGMSLDVSWGNVLGAAAIQQNIHVGDANRDGRDDLVAFNPTAGVNKWQVALSQSPSSTVNSFVLSTSLADGTVNTRLEFEFRSGSQGLLHAIGWDIDTDGTNDAAAPFKRFKLFGSGSPAGYPG